MIAAALFLLIASTSAEGARPLIVPRQAATEQQPANAQQAANPQQTADQLIARCQIKDASSTPEERVSCWELAEMFAPKDLKVILGVKDARAALQDAEKVKILQSQALSKSSRDSIEFLLTRARNDLVTGSVDGADTYVTRVLEIERTNSDALQLREQIRAARTMQARKQLFMAVGGALLVFGVVAVAFAKRIGAWREKSAASPSANASSSPARATPGRVALRIVDGLGRGRMYTIESDTFRIGAAESDRAEERNDLILSDSDGRISRFHCALLKRGKRWTIIDSSANGTWVNERRLERGAPTSIRDGDELTLAGASRIVFIGL